MKPLVYAGGEVNFRWQRPGHTWGIFTEALFKAGIPNKTGIMEDRDWEVLNYPQVLTRYSKHDNKTEQTFLIDARFGASFRVFNIFLLKPSITYNYMFFSWSATGGSFLYYPSSIGIFLPIKVISYEQTWHILSPALAFDGAFNRYFDIELSLAIIPFVWNRSVDNHILRDLVVTGKTNGGLFIDGGLRFSFTPVDFFALSLSAAYRNITGSRGNITWDEKNTGKRITYKNIGGAAYSVFDLGITARFRIF
jgi:outer membrane protease